MTFSIRKLVRWGYQVVTNFDGLFSRFDTIPARDGQNLVTASGAGYWFHRRIIFLGAYAYALM